MTASSRVVFEAFAAERARQDAKWGAEQTNPDGTGLAWRVVAVLARWSCDRAYRRGRCTWRHIAMEEVTEAFTETDPERLRAELVQAGAVITEWIEDLDRKQSAAR